MDTAKYHRWARRFRMEAASDDYRLVVAGWERGVVTLASEREPIQKWRARELVRDTIELLALVVSLYQMDGREGGERLLGLQTYDPTRSEGRYLLLFELGKYRRTQVVVDELRQVDLADLYDALGFAILVISHCDGSDFAPDEHAALREAIDGDVHWDREYDDVRLVFQEYPTGMQVEFIQ